MHEPVLSSDLDNLVVAIPFIVMLLAAFFRLDELFATPKKPAGIHATPAASTKMARSSCATRTEGDGMDGGWRASFRSLRRLIPSSFEAAPPWSSSARDGAILHQTAPRRLPRPGNQSHSAIASETLVSPVLSCTVT